MQGANNTDSANASASAILLNDFADNRHIISVEEAERATYAPPSEFSKSAERGHAQGVGRVRGQEQHNE